MLDREIIEKIVINRYGNVSSIKFEEDKYNRIFISFLDIDGMGTISYILMVEYLKFRRKYSLEKILNINENLL